MKQDNRRVSQVERQVQQILSEYLLRSFQKSSLALITITRVIMPADLRTAKVYISIFAQDNLNTDLVFEEVKKDIRGFQSYLGNEFKSRYCPKITFYQDQSFEKRMKLDQTLDELSKKQ